MRRVHHDSPTEPKKIVTRGLTPGNEKTSRTMSQTCPSSSHQLVAAAFRRARKKFPKNFGQLSWPIKYESTPQDKVVQSSPKACKNCDERFACREIRNSRSNNVWPSFTNTWTISDPRSTRSMRENSTSLMRRNSNVGTTGTTNHVVCPCRRRICKSWKKRNFAVSFSGVNEKSNNRRISGGDAGHVEEKNSNETISRKSCERRSTTRNRTSDCCCVEKKKQTNDDDGEKNGTRRRRNIEKKIDIVKPSCVWNEISKDFETIEPLDLLYDRGSSRTKNSVSFSSAHEESDINVSQAEEGAIFQIDFPNQIHEWEDRTRRFEEETEREKINRDEEDVNCDCDRNKNGQVRGKNRQKRRSFHHSHQPRHEQDHYPNDSSVSQDLSPRTAESRGSCCNETARLCKDCALAQCSRNSILVSRVRANASKEGEEEDCACRGEDVCAIKHKDSMAILVEKFKNKKIVARDDDETTTLTSDEDSSSFRTRINERKIESRYADDYRELSNDDEANSSWQDRRKNARSISRTRQFNARSRPKNLESRVVRSGRCCSVKEN